MIDQQTLQKNGFFYFDICTTEEIEKLKVLYSETHRKNETNGMFIYNSDTAIGINKTIYRILGSSIHKLFPDYDYFLGRIAVKNKCTFHAFDLHRDWNLVDESVYNSIQVWIPLSISYPENGGMYFIPRSHLCNSTPRSGSLGNPFMKVDQDIYPYLSYTRLHPGQAVCFYCNTLHGSFSNPTESDRIAIIITLVSKGAKPSYLYYNNEKKTIQSYSISANDFLLSLPDWENGNTPSTQLIQETPVDGFEKQFSLSKEEIIEWIKHDRAGQNLLPEYEFKQRSILKDSEQEKEVNERGFTIIQLLTAAEMESLQMLFKKYCHDYGSLIEKRDFYTDEGEDVSLLMTEILKHRLDLFFKDYAPPTTFFHSDLKGSTVETDWHADPSHVFNSHLDSYYGCWCPFSDIESAMNVVPFSHRLLNQLVSAVFPWPLKDKRRLLDAYGKSVSLKAGETLLFDTRLIYCSPLNTFTTDKIGITLKIAHKHTKYISISSSEKENTVIISKRDKDFVYDDVMHKQFQMSPGDDFSGELKIFPYLISDEEIRRKLNSEQYV